MNKKFIKLIVLAIFVAQFHFIFADTIVAPPGLQYQSTGESIILTWETTSEVNLKHFVVKRRALDGEFVQIATVEPRSDHKYEFVDRSVYKSESSVYKYLVVIIENDGRENGVVGEVSVAPDLTSVRRTWGSIKALFR